MSSEIVYYDIIQKRFVYNTTGHELAIKDYPSITFKEQKTIIWSIGFWDSNTRAFINMDLTHFGIQAWQSSVDVDFTRTTEPMIRVLNDNINSFMAKNGMIIVSYNADTQEFENAVDGQADGQRKIYIELKGYDANGKLSFFARPRLAQLYGEMQIDPGTDPTGETASNYYTKSEGDGRYAAKSDIPANIESTDHKNQANGYAGLDENSKLAGTQLLYGTTENTACQGNDSRLSDSRIPTAHASSHLTGQSDAIQSADTTHNGLMTSTQASKLETIELNADVTDIGNIGSSIHGANVKNTLIDNDEIALIDSAASNVLKKTFWSSIKSTLKTYFDTFYFGTTDTPAQGDVLYHNGSAYKLLPHGTDGQFLKTQGTGANPVWATPSGAGDVLAPESNTDNYVPQWNGTNSKTLKDGLSIGNNSGSLVLRSGNNSIAADTISEITPTNGVDVDSMLIKDGGIANTDLPIGTGTDTDINIQARNGDVNPPSLRYNHSTNKWQYSNDGTTFNDITSISTVPTDELWLTTSNGYGSTNAAVRRFANIIKNNGLSITYTDSPINGASFTINTPGIYAISYSDCMNTANNIVVALNSNAAASNVPLANRLTIATTNASGYVVNCSCITHLTTSDVIRCTTDGATNSGNESKVQVIITRLC